MLNNVGCWENIQRLLQRIASGESELSKVVSLDLHDRNIHQIQRLEVCAPSLRILDLSFNQITKLEGCVFSLTWSLQGSKYH